MVTLPEPAMNRNVRNRRTGPLLCLAVLAAFGIVFAHAAPASGGRGYTEYSIGKASAPRPGKVEPGMMLVGGGDWPYDAFRWMIEKSGHGHIVILRASGAKEAQDEFYTAIGGVASARTFVFNDRKGASDPALLAAIDNADGIFIAGGDQANYVRYWKGTPLNVAIDRHVRAGKPIGGTSAGLAILGAYAYGAMDGGSITSEEAMRDPLGPAVTLVGVFLHLPGLEHVITDSHFSKRDRLGRLIAFVANLRHGGAREAVGLGIDEGAALCIDGDGLARLYPGKEGGYAWLVQPTRPSSTIAAGRPLELGGVRITGIGADSRLHLPSLDVDAPAFSRIADVHAGVLASRESGAAAPKPASSPVLVVHGGAGFERKDVNAAEEAGIRAALTLALRRGHAALAAGKPALDAVTAALTVLEDDPLFNAGKGAVFTHDGRNELDASLMDGATLAAGAVAGVHRVRNPILLARAVMEHSPHVMMVGDGAEAFAKEQGIALVDPSYFRTEKRWEQLQQALREDAAGQPHARLETARHFGTVGAVALDREGRLAAGTSTGGMTDKRYGRVGDSPIIGAGTYANATCAVSGTGWGEYYIRVVAAHEICSRMAYLKESPQQAGAAVIERQIPAMGGDGGAIVLAADGRAAAPFNTEGMARGWIGADGEPHVAIFSDEALPEPPAAH
jgi:beta-aspartyl-peptidase (threonine type)